MRTATLQWEVAAPDLQNPYDRTGRKPFIFIAPEEHV
jgi:hypothetical protein